MLGNSELELQEVPKEYVVRPYVEVPYDADSYLPVYMVKAATEVGRCRLTDPRLTPG